MDAAQADLLLTTTRSVRKRLDLLRPVEPAVIERAIEIALQAPTGSNSQGTPIATPARSASTTRPGSQPAAPRAGRHVRRDDGERELHVAVVRQLTRHVMGSALSDAPPATKRGVQPEARLRGGIPSSSVMEG